MKVLIQGGMQYNASSDLTKVISRLGPIASVQDMSQIAKALNDYGPDLLIVVKQYINGIVEAYRDQNGLKIISLGESDKADISIPVETDVPRASLETFGFKEDVEKTDISVFCENPDHVFLASFLCENYNVKAYGPVKINSPRYLGMISDVDMFEILNKSKVSIVFNVEDAQRSAALGTYPISYCKDNLVLQTFTGITSLMECMDDLLASGVTDKMKNDLQIVIGEFKQKNNFTYVADMLTQLGFSQQAAMINSIIQEIVQ